MVWLFSELRRRVRTNKLQVWAPHLRPMAPGGQASDSHPRSSGRSELRVFQREEQVSEKRCKVGGNPSAGEGPVSVHLHPGQS